MSKNQIPCTVLILTRNSEHTIKSCLHGIKDVAEVLLLDGYSTDETVHIAQSFSNVRVINQDRMFLDADGRIADFASIRNQGLKEASNKWILFIDSDEKPSPELIREVSSILTKDQPGVFEVQRIFYAEGQRIDRCAYYPALQIRLFHTSLIDGFTKIVHEKLVLKKGVKVQRMATELATPLPDANALWPKYRRYIELESARLEQIGFWRWLYWVCLRNLRSSAGLLLRSLYIRLTPGKGTRMPFAYEALYIRYLLTLIPRTFPKKFFS